MHASLNAKKHLLGFNYHVFGTEIMRFKAISVYNSDIRFSERTHPKHTSQVSVTRHVSTKLSSLLCLIALKLSNTHKFMLKNKHKLQKHC